MDEVTVKRIGDTTAEYTFSTSIADKPVSYDQQQLAQTESYSGLSRQWQSVIRDLAASNAVRKLELSGSKLTVHKTGTINWEDLDARYIMPAFKRVFGDKLKVNTPTYA